MAAINQTDKELNDRLLQYARTIANGDRTLEQTLRAHAKSLGSVQQDVVSEYEEHLNASRTWHGKEAQAAKERLIRMKKLEQQADKAQAEQIDADLDFQKKLKELRQDELAARRSNDTKQVGLVRRQMIQLQQNHTEETKRRKAEQELGRWAAAERRAFERTELSAQAKWGNAFRKVTSEAAISAIKGALGGATLSGAIVNVTKDAYAGIKKGMMTGGYGVGMLPESMGGSAFNINTMSKFGYNMEQSIQLQAENRRAILSSTNGMKDFVGGMEDAYQKFDFIASPLDRSKIAIDSYNIAVKAGIRMSKEQATMFVNDIKKFTKYTGENATEFTAHIGSIMESQEIQDSLLGAANEMQRKAILDGVAAQYTANRAMGMTADQAKKTATSLAALENRKGKTVISQSAKTAALASVLGMGKEGAELRRIQMKRQNATPEERQRAQQIMNEMRNRYDTRTRGDVTGAKMGLESVFEKLGGAEFLGKEFNTTGVQATAPQEKAFETIPEIPKAIQDGTAKLEEIKTILQNHPLAQIGVGAAGSALSMLDVAGGSMGGTLGANILSRFIPGLAGAGGAAGAGTAAGAGGAAAGAGVASTAGIAALAAAAIAAGGTGIYAAVQAARGEDASNWISDGFDKMTGGWNMFEALDNLVGGPLSESNAKINELDRTVKGKIVEKKPDVVDPAKKATEKKPELSEDEKKKIEAEQKAEQERMKREREANDLLKNLSENSQRQVELAERQLVAMTMSDDERLGAKNNLRKDNRFGSKYGYV